MRCCRRFFDEHLEHRIVFGEGGIFFDSNHDWFLDWIQEGFLADPLLRFLYERLKLRSWTAVCEYVEALKSKPSWWMDRDERERAEQWYKVRLVRDLSDSELRS